MFAAANAAVVPGKLTDMMPGLASTVATRKLGMSNVATLQRDSVPTNLNQTNVQPVYDIYASVQGRDLGSISNDIGKVVAELQKELKRCGSPRVRGRGA
jgi:Cu/Ag efflux pump CusA